MLQFCINIIYYKIKQRSKLRILLDSGLFKDSKKTELLIPYSKILPLHYTFVFKNIKHVISIYLLVKENSF